MKAGLAALAGAIRALRSLDVEPLAPVHLLSVVEEECTGNGALQCLISGLHADGCVLTEPHYQHITTAQVGVLWFSVEVTGIAAHAGHAELGANAIDGVWTTIGGLRELERELNHDPPAPFDRFQHPIHLNVGLIEGGDWPSTVAASCTARCRIGLYPGQEPEQLMQRVERVVAAASRGSEFLAADPPTVRYDGFACEGFALGDDEPLAVTLADACEAALGERRCPRRRRRPPTPVTSSAPAFPLSASDRSRNESTASTSASRCPRWSAARTPWPSSCAAGAGCGRRRERSPGDCHHEGASTGASRPP